MQNLIKLLHPVPAWSKRNEVGISVYSINSKTLYFPSTKFKFSPFKMKEKRIKRVFYSGFGERLLAVSSRCRSFLSESTLWRAVSITLTKAFVFDMFNYCRVYIGVFVCSASMVSYNCMGRWRGCVLPFRSD